MKMIIAALAILIASPLQAAPQTFILVDEAVQDQVGPVTRNIPSVAPTIAQIKMMSTEFQFNKAFRFTLRIEESFDSGVTWKNASGFPSIAAGGLAGLGGRDGLPVWEYYFDGRARQLRLVCGPSETYDWGLTVTLL